MKTKTFKSVMTIAACVALILLAGFVLTACGSKADIYATDYVVENWGIKGYETDFENTDDFKLEKVDGNNYKAVGTPATFTAEQAAAFGGVTETDHFVIISIKMETGSTIRRAWVSRDEMDVALTEEDDASPYTGTEGVREYLLWIDDHADAPVWRIEVTAPVADGEEAGDPVVYTIDFTDMLEELLAA